MKNKLIRISALSYLNTYPFAYALMEKLSSKIGEIQFEVPAISAQRFKNKEVDIALVPVGSLQDLIDYEIITNYCIGSYGKVKTVSLYSKVPIHEIKKVFLDSESRTSINLVKILAKNFWKIDPEYLIFQNNMNPLECDSVVLIGDKTFSLNDKFPYTIDLSEEWLKYTGLPFVFAVWIKQRNFSSEFISELNNIFQFGIDNIPLIYDKFKINISRKEFEDYLNNFIDFNFDLTKKSALKKFQFLQHNL